MGRLEEQLRWYEGKSRYNKRAYFSLKVVEIVVAAAIPALAAAGASVGVAGVLGAVVVVLEGLQQLFQFHQSWVSYRGTAEALQRERFLYEAGAGPYTPVDGRERRLAERVEELVSQEHAAWAESHRAPAEAAEG
jgi:hypothetical protein